MFVFIDNLLEGNEQLNGCRVGKAFPEGCEIEAGSGSLSPKLGSTLRSVSTAICLLEVRDAS